MCSHTNASPTNMLAVRMAWLPLLGAVGWGHQLWPLSHGGTHFSNGFPQRAGEPQLTFGDGGALVRVTAWSGTHGMICLPKQGRGVAEEEPPQGLWDVWAGGEQALAAVLRGLSHLHQVAGLVPAVSQGSGESSSKVTTVRDNPLLRIFRY